MNYYEYKMNIAVLLTCHNRKQKTENCLNSFLKAIDFYNNSHKTTINYKIFLTDDGCTDGTAEAIRNILPDKSTLHVLHGDGYLYWAGGMRMCWKEALKSDISWNYYFLLNDDVELMNCVFSELFNAEQYTLKNIGAEGLVSGITCNPEQPAQVTYGGSVWTNKMLFTHKRLNPIGTPQPCDIANANILLVPAIIVKKIGIFYDKYQHSLADYDYSIMAHKAGFPVILTANACGYCQHDHNNQNAESKKIIGMSLTERKKYFQHPTRSNKDYLSFIKRVCPLRLPIVWIGRTLNVYLPRLYYTLRDFSNRIAPLK